jgi:hypothetical protein
VLGRRLYSGLLIGAVLAGSSALAPTEDAVASGLGAPLASGTSSCGSNGWNVTGSPAVRQGANLVAEVRDSAGASWDAWGLTGSAPILSAPYSTALFSNTDRSWTDLSYPGDNGGVLDRGAVGAGHPVVVGECNAKGRVMVKFFAVPATPVTYTGKSSFGARGTDYETDPDANNYSSVLPFITAKAGAYEAKVTLTRGAITVNNPNWGVEDHYPQGCMSSDQRFTSSGTCILGTLRKGQKIDLSVSADRGPQAQWTISVAPAPPVSITALLTTPLHNDPTGKSITLAVSVSGDTRLTFTIFGRSRHVVAKDSGFHVTTGKTEFTWNPKAAGVTSGTYTIQVTSTDPFGHVDTKSVSVTVGQP